VRVRLACQPPILNEVLARVISDVPGVELVGDSQGAADVVVISAPGAGADGPPTPAGILEPHVRLIALDPNTNAARVWQGGAPSDVLLPGDLASLRRLLQPASAWQCDLTDKFAASEA
jgi:hypothetical protein